MIKKLFSLALFLAGFISCFFLRADQATPPVLDEEILLRIQREVSGSICFEHVRELTTFHRIWGSHGYHQAAAYIVEKASAYGLKEATIEKYPIKTGRESYWMQSLGGDVPWDCRSAEVRLVSPFRRLITDFESAPSTVAIGSRSTDITSEVVYVGHGDSPEDYEGKDIRGKIVLAEGGGHGKFHEFAVHHFGALGTMHYSSASGNYHESEGIYWGRISPWNKDQTRLSTFGINISASQGQWLKELLSQGQKVVVSVRIQAEIINNGFVELATAVIPGSQNPEEEFIFYAHLDHPKPGAHDNGSGDAVLLEIARTLSRLIENKVIAAPRRSIRFMWIPHMSGLNMYFSTHPEKIGKIKGGCNIDCVGADPAKFPTKLYIALPPHSLYSSLVDIAGNLVSHFNHDFDQAVILGENEKLLFSPEGSRNLFSATLVPYQGASDEYTANTRSLNMPSLYFFEEPLPPRHNQINYLAYIDPTILGRVSYLGAIISYAFTNIGGETAVTLLNESRFRGECRLKRETVMAKSLLEKSGRDDILHNIALCESLLAWGLKRELAAARFLKEMIPIEKGLAPFLSLYKAELDHAASSAQRELRAAYRLKCASLGINPDTAFKQEKESTVAALIPVLNPLIKGSPGYSSNYFEDILGEDFLKAYPGVRQSFRYGNIGYYETLNYIDGRNTTADIYNAVQAELWSEGYDAYHSLTFQETVNYLLMLKDARVIDFRKSVESNRPDS